MRVENMSFQYDCDEFLSVVRERLPEWICLDNT